MATAVRKRRAQRLDWLQPAVLAGSLLPPVVIVWRAMSGRLGANPIATAMNQLGYLALVLLLSSLACTPLKIVTGHKWPMRLRKTLGLMGFFTVLAHFLVYAMLDQLFVIRAIVDDVLSRPFIAIGFLAFALLVPLALTSNKNSTRQLGFERWKRLHRLAYIAPVLGVIHFYMRVKKDTTEPVLFAIVLGALFAVRVVHHLRHPPNARK